LEGSTPSNDPNKGETNVWNNTGTSVSISGGTNTNQPLTLNAVGESQISYTIKNNDPNCIASVKTIKIKVNDIPVLDQITGVPNLCEGKSDAYSVSLKTGLGINTEPITDYSWSSVSSATGSATLLGSGIGSSANFSFQSTSNTGSTDTASIKVIAKNVCGNSLPLTRKIAIDLKPRDFVGDISGIDKVCESAITAEKYSVSPQANTTSYEWTLGNKILSGTQPMLETSIPISELVAQKPVATLKVTLSNVCGAGVEKTKSITITPSIQVDAKITGQNSVCLPTDNVVYQGSSTNAGTNAIYTFEIIHPNNSIGKTQSSSNPDFATIKGDLEDGDKIKLTIMGNATVGCFSSTGTDEILIDGYEYPDSTITVSKDSICEGDGAITLSVNSTFNQNNKKNDNGKIQWHIMKNNSDSLLANLNGLYSISISKPNESGTYKVKVPGSVCVHDSKAEQIVKIYEKPIIRLLQDPLEVIYQEGISVPMPVAINGLKNDTISKATWTPDTWLSATNTLDAKFVPKKEKKEIDYTLTVSTGSGNITCETQANVKIINTLPLIIPNAFSPNGDGINDVWEIQGLTKYKSVTITVFNRWGNSVFSSKGEYTPWDGTINGIPMSVATYYAIIELKESLDNTDQTITQPLTIVR
jgi:gliding motility-associated-like protein